MKHLDEMPNKQQHCYLVSYQAGKHTGHTHIYCDAPLTPPRDTVDIIKTTADDIGCDQGDVIITSIFYFGFIFPQAVIEDEQGQEEPEKEKGTWKVWMEGYLLSGMEGSPSKAKFLGEFKGETFKDAVEAYIATIEESEQHYYSAKDLSFFGCKFFDNEADARKAFG